jgi:hypothetical protein
MPGTPGPRTGLADILTGDAATEYRVAINAIRDWLEANAPLTGGGLFADRPTSSPSTPGITGRSYFAYDLGAMLRDTGTGWVATGATTVGVYSARPPVSTDLNGLRYFATDKAMEWEMVGGAWMLVNAYAPEVSALPASPIDQQECVLILDATTGIKVHLRYRSASASASKWETVGQPPEIVAETTANQGAVTTASPATSNLAVALTIPFAGDWDIEVFTAAADGDSAANAWGRIAYKINGAGPDSLSTLWVRQSGNDTYRPYSFRRRRAGLTAAAVLQLVSSTDAGAFYPNGNAVNPIGLRARQVRLG